MDISNAFFDPNGTLRSGWRFAVFVVGIVLAGGFAGTVVFMVLHAATTPGTALVLTVNGLVSTFIALLVGWLCAKYLERLPFRSLGAAFSKGWAKNLIVGMLVGGLTFAAAAVVGMISGTLSFIPNTAASTRDIAATLSVSFLIFLAAAAFEEALLRGYVLQTFVRSNLTVFAVVFTSLIFATLHNTNPAATWLSWTNTFLAGIWLAVAYLKTRDLWMPLGVHLAWNWVQGSIFGVEVSGLTDIVTQPLMRESDLGPAWLTGGEYGVEGGLLCTLVLLASTAAVHYLPFIRPDEDLLTMNSPRESVS